MGLIRDIDGTLLQRRGHRVPNKYPLQWFFLKMTYSTVILGILSTGTYAGIVTKFVSSLKMLWKEHKNRKKPLYKWEDYLFTLLAKILNSFVWLWWLSFWCDTIKPLFLVIKQQSHSKIIAFEKRLITVILSLFFFNIATSHGSSFILLGFQFFTDTLDISELDLKLVFFISLFLLIRWLGFPIFLFLCILTMSFHLIGIYHLIEMRSSNQYYCFSSVGSPSSSSPGARPST